MRACVCVRACVLFLCLFLWQTDKYTRQSRSAMTMENLCWFLAAFALVVTISSVRADECICPFKDGSADCNSKKLTEIPKCVTNRKEPVHSLYVLLSLCPNRHLANFLSGFVTGKAKSIGKIIATFDSHSFKNVAEMTSSCTRPQSSLPKFSCVSSSLRISP